GGLANAVVQLQLLWWGGVGHMRLLAGEGATHGRKPVAVDPRRGATRRWRWWQAPTDGFSPPVSGEELSVDAICFSCQLFESLLQELPMTPRMGDGAVEFPFEFIAFRSFSLALEFPQELEVALGFNSQLV